ncbi:MAG: MBL fold metallo-hydrolase [Clostridiales bacterium]|nr:MBL fold metallo-hydrolase [Clostridiales bacterium]
MYFRLDHGIYMVAGGDSGPGISNFKDCNVYLVEGNNTAFLIDGGSGMNTSQIIQNIKETGCDLCKITHMFVTHAHGDHSGGIHDYKTYIPQIKILASNGEKRLIETGSEEELGLVAAKLKGSYPQNYIYKHCHVDMIVDDWSFYEVGDAKITAILLPGHSISSTCYIVEKNQRRYFFSGDSIYLDGKLGLINCYGSTMEGYRNNIGKLVDLRIDALIPSHFRLTMQNGQSHINKAIEALKYSSLPPMV